MKTRNSLLITALMLFFTSGSYSQLNCIDSALSFSGDGQYLKLAPNDFSGSNFLSSLPGDYTIECLIKWNGGADYQRIFDFSWSGTYLLFLTPSEDVNHFPRFVISATGLSAPQIVDANTAITQGIFHHIAVTYSQSASLVKIYLDGTEVGSNTVTIDADSIYYGNDAHNGSYNFVGLSSFPNDPQLNGTIDEFRISNIVRYESNFTPVVPFSTDANTVILHHFDEGSGQFALDDTPNSDTAQLGETINTETSDPTRVSCSGVLATNLSSFTITSVQDKVQLKWTSSETNTDYFEVQRSANGNQFQPVHKITASPGTNVNYSYTDDSPIPGKNYYRLKLADKAGGYDYSQVLYTTVTKNSFTVYPTFTTGKLHVSALQTPSDIIIYNATGKAVKRIMLQSPEQDIDISSLAAGNYIMYNTMLNKSVKFVKR
ncbi:MAG TPA: LamG-like jellyroll fold domain-containing protein [Parafilimonas sp.]|nr:LamG-like jellyroll fold domain-containing protein [Parafilimonas sp.]